MSQIEAQIMGQGYALGCPDGAEERLHQAVGAVDLAMCKIRDAGKIKARERIAVLAAINIAFDLHETAKDPQNPSPMNSTDIAQLISRLDDALADDGKLL
ncbi:MAG: cell division protein ZapA [Burkholderiaceae bacterium]|jgi:cell division protein ZapA